MDGDSSKKRKIFLWIFLVALFSLAIAFCFWFLRGPAVGTVTKKEASLSEPKKEEAAPLGEFRGEFFSIRLPESFLLKRHETPEDSSQPILEQAFFSEENISGRKAAIVAERLPSGGISELSGYRFRESEREIYSFERVSVGDRSISLFKKEGEVSEATGFFAEGKCAMSMSLSSAVIRTEILTRDFLTAIPFFEFSSECVSNP